MMSVTGDQQIENDLPETGLPITRCTISVTEDHVRQGT
jgi:hypothetical protein